LLTALADQAAVAVEKTRLLQQERQARASVEALNAIIASTTSQTEMQPLLEAVLDRTLQALGLEQGAVWAFNEVKVLRGIPRDVGQEIAAAARSYGQTIEDVCVIPDWMEAKGFQKLKAILLKAGIRASMAAPLVAGTTQLGSIVVASSQPRRWHSEEMALIEAVGRQVGAAAERVRLLEAEHQHVQELTLLNRITASAVSTLDFAKTLQIACQGLAEAFQASRVGVALLNPKRDRWTIVAEYRLVDGPSAVGRSGPAAKSADTLNNAVRINDLQHDPYLSTLSDLLQKASIQSILAVPIRLDDQTEGRIYLADTRPRDWTSAQVETIRLVAAVLVQALDRARLHEQVRAQAATLEMRVEERTEELKRALQAKNEFLAMMTHELRTPLNSLLGFAHMLAAGQAGELSPRAQHYVENIVSSGEHLLALINDLLDMARIEAGKLKIERRNVSLNELVESVVMMLRPRATEKGLALLIDVTNDLPVLSADPLRVRQVLYNLVDNAIKFTNAGFVRIRVRTAKRRDDLPPGAPEGVVMPCVVVSVTDTGIGITPEDMERLFQPFEQLANPMTRPYSGTGLGLALSRRLVEMHGGHIWAVSEPGKGSTFTFTLPLNPPTEGSGVSSS
ncbi:MAG: GAF domain-containing protein, partial [Anaerolineae bacterium]|nr:GAF domain-containing protein [Anaerolineae bacterium]